MKDSPVSYLAAEIESNKQSTVIRIAFFDVGQGDTIVISSPDTSEAIVVDCVDSESVLEYLKQEKMRYLRGVVVTHLHQDHYIQVDDLLYRSALVPSMQECEKLAFRIINKKHFEILIRDADGHQEQGGSLTPEQVKRLRKTTLENMMAWCLEDKQRRHFEPCVQAIIHETEVSGITPIAFKGTLAKNIFILHPYAIDLYSLESKGLNNTSVALRVLSSGSSALLTGDLEPEGWQVLRSNYSDLHSDVLKFPHHGGAWGASDTKSLLDVVQPSIVVISVGTEGEKYKHPNKEVFDVLSSPAYSHIRVCCTQATNQCQESVIDQKKSVIHFLDKQASSRGYERIGSKRGCPCSGTVIVELGDQARVVQPTMNAHQDSIILPHFHNHKCFLSTTSPTENVSLNL